MNKKKDFSMKFYHLSLLILTTITIHVNAKQHLATFFNPRSISRDAARDLAGWTNYINLNHDTKSVYGAISITPEWTKTFRNNRITSCLFGENLHYSSSSPSLTISGS